MLAVSSDEASSTTITSTSLPDARALAIARGKRSGRLYVVMMMLALGIRPGREGDTQSANEPIVAIAQIIGLSFCRLTSSLWSCTRSDELRSADRVLAQRRRLRAQ